MTLAKPANRIPRNLWLVGLISLFTDWSSQMIFPLLPLFLTQSLGAGAAVVGLVEGAAESVAALLKLWSGGLSDRMARRKPFVVAGYAASSLAKALFVLANGWATVLLARVVERIGKGVRSAPRDALVADTAPASERGGAYGWQRAMDGAGSMLGALTALLLIGFFSYKTVFALALIPAVVALFLTTRLQEPAEASARSASRALSLPRLDRGTAAAVWAAAAFAFSRLSFAFLLLAGLDRGAGAQGVLAAYALYQAVYTLSSPRAGKASDRWGRRPVLLTGYGLQLLMLLVLAEGSLLSVVLAGMIYGVSEAAVDGTQRAWIVDHAAGEGRGGALGWYHAAIAATALPGAWLLGLIWQDHGAPTACALSAALTLIAALALWRVPSPRQNPG